MKVTVIDYGLSNLRSVANALARCGAEVELTADPAAVRAARGLVLPGAGTALSNRCGKRPQPAPRCWASALACRCCLRNPRNSACTKALG